MTLGPSACPFCGRTQVTADDVKPGVWALGCPGCGAQGPVSRDGLADAVRLWNARAAGALRTETHPIFACCLED